MLTGLETDYSRTGYLMFSMLHPALTTKYEVEAIRVRLVKAGVNSSLKLIK
jgi:hypothetical protein